MVKSDAWLWFVEDFLAPPAIYGCAFLVLRCHLYWGLGRKVCCFDDNNDNDADFDHG